MAAQNLSVYLPQELADEVDQAKKAGLIDPKIICKDALQAALHPLQLAPATDDATVREELQRSLAARDIIGGLLGIAPDEISWSGLSNSVEQLVTMVNNTESAVAEPASDHPERQGSTGVNRTTYEIKFADSLITATAMIETVQEQDGWIQSVAPTMDGQLLLLVAWPKDDFLG